MRERIKDFLDKMKEGIEDLLDEIKLPVLGGLIGSFIGMALAKLIGIL